MPRKGTQHEVGNLKVIVTAFATEDRFTFSSVELAELVRENSKTLTTTGYKNLSEITHDFADKIQMAMFDTYNVPWFTVEIIHNDESFYEIARENPQ